MCDYCNGKIPLIKTGLVGLNENVAIWKDKLVAEANYVDAYGKETVNKGIKINYCPMCGKELRGK